LNARSAAIALAITVLAIARVAADMAEATTSSWTSPQFGFGVSWEGPWSKVGEESVRGQYDVLRLVAPRVFEEFYGIASVETDPPTILHAFVDRFRSEMKELTIKQEWSRGGARPLPMIIEFTAGTGVRTTEILATFPLEQGTSVYVNVSGREGDLMAGYTSEELRELDRLVQLRLPGASEAPTPVLTPAPAPMPTPDAEELVAAARLADALRSTPFPDATLIDDAGAQPMPPFVVSFDAGNYRVARGITYLVYANSANARDGFHDVIADAQRKFSNSSSTQDATADFGRTATLITINWPGSAYYVLVDNVVVVGSYAFGQASGGLVETTAGAYDLVQTGIAHLELVKASLS
jgi:hypothetical protein